MTKQFAKYMTYGKKVACSWTCVIFSLIENMDGNKETVRAVNLKNLRQYQMLNAWSRNWDNDSKFRERFSAGIEKGEHGTIEDCREKRKSYEVELKISDITAKDKIRFITPNYDTKFEVDNLCDHPSNTTCPRYSSDEMETIWKSVIHFVQGQQLLHLCETHQTLRHSAPPIEFSTDRYLHSNLDRVTISNDRPR